MQIGKRLAALTGVAGLTLALSFGTALAADNDAGKAQLFGHAFGNCQIGGTGGTPQDGFAILKQNGNGTVSTTVSLKNAPPNAVYDVFLVQTPSGAGCSTPLAQLTTNAQGNGNVHIDAPLLPGTTDAFALLFPANPAAAASGVIASRDVVF